MGAYKQFDKKLFNQNDAEARKICIRYFEGRGYTIKDNPDKYGPDLIIMKKDGTVGAYVEVERKKVWKTHEFPFENVQFPERKKKFCLNKEGLFIIFFMFNLDYSRALIVMGKDLMRSPLAEVSNVYMESGELFFQVPLKKVAFVDVE